MVGTLRAGIVGGSISGCATAVMLRRLGHDVTVFERSRAGLLTRGVGIATRPSVLARLARHDLIGPDFPHITLRTDRWIGRRASCEPAGHVAGSFLHRDPMAALNWGDLFDDLRRRIPETVYRLDAEVEAIDATRGSTSAVHLADGSEHVFDLVVCADGYRSLGRASLFPESELRYRGYVLWRGLLDESDLNGSPLLDDGVSRVAYRGGYAVFYYVPGGGTASAAGRRCVNWGAYLQVPPPELDGFLTDRLGRVGEGSIAAGMMPPDREAALKRWAELHLPGLYAEICGRSQKTFVQAVYTTRVDEYSRGRTVLVGDAGSVFPPFTASGVFKGMNSAIDLGEALEEHDDVDDALAAWNARQIGHALATEGPADAMEEAWIFSMPDVGSMDNDAYSDWTRSFFTKFRADRASPDGSLLDGTTGVDGQRDPRDVPSLVRGQEKDGVADIDRLDPLDG
jgi:2-polyprenyl-6-methoxyphenol hydroxylase-like FAD-dependent oxidoreductase